LDVVSDRRGPAATGRCTQGLAHQTGFEGASRQRLDAGAAEVSVGQFAKERSYFVEDNGPGITSTPEDDFARLFSIKRPMISSNVPALTTARKKPRLLHPATYGL
jgi:hypothetical protein